MDADSVVEKIAELAPWHFKMELLPGVWTAEQQQSGVQLVAVDEMAQMLARLFPNGLAGKRFLDVACNAGAYCFLAHEMGASACIGFDIRDHWIKQAEFIRELKHPNANIQFSVADAKTFTADEPFAVTMFKGIFYHLPDPVSTLKRVADMTTELIILDTETWTDAPENCMYVGSENTAQAMSGVDGVTWMPGGPAALKPILSWMGFAHTRVHRWVRRRAQDPAARGYRHGRIRILAARDDQTFTDYDKKGPKKA